MPWLTGPYRAFGERLGAVLFRIPDKVRRDDERLARLLTAWPADMPLVLELPDPSWADDDVTRAVAAAGATICITERPEDDEPPTIRRTSDRLYLRLRRHDYDAAAIDSWAARLEPFLADGVDAFVFFRHDDIGQGPEFALALAEAVNRRMPPGSPPLDRSPQGRPAAP